MHAFEAEVFAGDEVAAADSALQEDPDVPGDDDPPPPPPAPPLEVAPCPLSPDKFAARIGVEEALRLDVLELGPCKAAGLRSRLALRHLLEGCVQARGAL